MTSSSSKNPRSFIQKSKRIVLKIGSSVLTENSSQLAQRVFDRFTQQIALYQKEGRKFIIVTSGAIAAGRAVLNFQSKKLTIPQKQAAAAVGQSRLNQKYQDSFSKKGITTAQILLTHNDLSDRSRYLNARHTVMTLLQNGVIPIINENDTVIVEEIKFGDNDTLGALITSLAEADLYILLTDTDGLFDRNPHENPNAKLIPLVSTIDATIEKAARDTSSKTAVGGMITKIEAAKRATSYGVPTLIANGHKTDTLPKIFSGEMIGTLFTPQKSRLASRKHWIAHTLRPKGVLTVDAGAAKALGQSGKSLLPSGITSVQGKFEMGEPVQIKNENKEVFAQGLVNYNSLEIGKIMGKKSSEIEKILGYNSYDEIIHRDDLVLMKESS